jgi:hypothetical protein
VSKGKGVSKLLVQINDDKMTKYMSIARSVISRCLVFAGMFEWSEWSPCSQTCSIGMQTRSMQVVCIRAPCNPIIETRPCQVPNISQPKIFPDAIVAHLHVQPYFIQRVSSTIYMPQIQVQIQTHHAVRFHICCTVKMGPVCWN